jgi:hypothetical protein
MPYPLCKTSPPYSIDAFQLLVFCFDKLNRYAREHEDAVGWTRDQRRVCGAGKRRDGVSLWHRSFRISCSRASRCVLKCTMAVSDTDCGCSFDTRCARRHELYAKAFRPNVSSYPGTLGKSASIATQPHSHTATQPQI